MSDEYPERSSGSSTLLIVLAVVGGLLLLVVLGCLGLGFFAFRAASGVMATAMQVMADISEATNEGNNFVAKLKDDDVAPAYDSTTEAFRKRQTLDEFKAFLAKNPMFKTHTAATVTNMNQSAPGGGPVVLQMSLSGNGSITCTLQMRKENGIWKVDSISVP